MKKKTVLVFVFDGMADWEAAYALTGINKSGQYMVRTLALDKSPKTTMGGVTICPDFDFFPQTDLKDLDASNTAMVILPGGDAWEKGGNEGISELVLHCFENQIPVAAICGATLLLADLGILDQVRHTSNSLDYLQSAIPAYRGQSWYQHEGAVADAGALTANGASPVEFAEVIFETLDIAENEAVKRWFGYFQNKMVDF